MTKKAKIEPKEDLEVKLNELNDNFNELNDKYLRTLAEYDNFRKRSTKEKEELSAFITSCTVKGFLPVYDNLERAVKAQPEDKGIELIFHQLVEIFCSLGVAEIEAVGKEFDPNLHNAVMHVEDENFEKNIVCEVFQKGFILGETVIRHSMVKVAN